METKQNNSINEKKQHYCQQCGDDLMGLHALQRFCPFKNGIPNVCKRKYHAIRLENRLIDEINSAIAEENDRKDAILFFQMPRKVKDPSALNLAMERIKILETNYRYSTRENIMLTELIEDGAEIDADKNFATLNGIRYKRKFLSTLYRRLNE